MFEGRNIGFGFYRGWFPIISKLCADIDLLLGENKRGFHWVQIKEKFGAGRFYWKMKSRRAAIRVDVLHNKGHTSFVAQGKERKSGEPEPDLVGQINALVQEAEDATSEVCILCGAPGKLDPYRGYLLTLCTKHARQRRRGSLPPAWFSDDED